MHQTEERQDKVQAVRPVFKRALSTTSTSTETTTSSSCTTEISTIPQADIINIPCQTDPATGTDIVLWDDVLAVYKDALFIRHETRALPFMKDGKSNE